MKENKVKKEKKNKRADAEIANSERAACAVKTSIGGQALIEGIMMRGPKLTAMAVRDPDGEIVLEKWETETTKRAKFFKLPIIRGVFGFIDSMRFGYKCLMRSAEIAGLEDEIDDTKKDKKDKKDIAAEQAVEENGTVAVDESEPIAEAVEEPVAAEVQSEEKTEEKTEEKVEEKAEKSEKDKKKESKDSSALMNTIMVIATVLGVLLAVVLFIWLPAQLYKWLVMLVPAIEPKNVALASLVKSVFEGVLRIGVLVLYMFLVSRMKDINRTFRYHGAEHKTIFCYEHGKELTVENVRNERRFHPRCGTSFLILMLLVSIIISFFIDPIFMLTLGYVPHTLIRTLVKLLMLPLVMGIGYELIKFAGRHNNLFTRIISAPGMWLQRLTVLEPDDSMIECALTAFKEVIPNDGSDKY